jgi:hypothetical protein
MLDTIALQANDQHDWTTPHRERVMYVKRSCLHACPPHLALRWLLTAEGLRMRWSIGTPHIPHISAVSHADSDFMAFSCG